MSKFPCNLKEIRLNIQNSSCLQCRKTKKSEKDHVLFYQKYLDKCSTWRDIIGDDMIRSLCPEFITAINYIPLHILSPINHHLCCNAIATHRNKEKEEQQEKNGNNSWCERFKPKSHGQGFRLPTKVSSHQVSSVAQPKLVC